MPAGLVHKATLAHRLGIMASSGVKEDLSFAITIPKKYEEIVRLVADRAVGTSGQSACEIVNTLTASKIKATVEGRPSTGGRSTEDDR